MLNKDSFVKLMHMSILLRDPCCIQITPQRSDGGRGSLGFWKLQQKRLFS